MYSLMEDNLYEKIIGNGMVYPIVLGTNSEHKTGWYPVIGDTKLISDNLNALLQYTIGERFRQEDFGTRLWECIEEPNTQAQAFLINTFLKEAISLYEDRINYKESIISRSGNKLHIEMHYILKQSNEEKSLNITYDNLTNSLS